MSVSLLRIEEPIQTWSKEGLPPFTEEDAIYPESDGLPMADSALQFDWVARIKQELDALFENDETVFVAGDHFWYPVEGRPDIRTAPDAMVIFGRPKGHRRSYREIEEAERVIEAERAAKEAAWAKLRELGIDPEKL